MKKQPDNINATVGPEPEKKIVKKRKKKGSIIIDVAALFLVGVIVTGLLTYFAEKYMSDESVTRQTEQRAAEIVDDTKRAVTEYPAYIWLIRYWYNHPDTMDIEYDADFSGNTRTEEKCRVFSERHPDLQIRYLSSAQCESLPEEDQKLYAEIAYSWLINRIDQIKRSFHVDFLFCVVSEEPYDKQFFLFSGADFGAKRGTTYEDVYPLGHMVSVSESQSLAMRKAVASSNHLADAGDYLDYYARLCPFDNHNVIIGVTYDLYAMRETIRSQTNTGTIFAVANQVVLSLICITLLFFFVLRPLKKVQKNIRKYKETKESDEVVAELEKIRLRNEIGDLSCDVSEMVREIDSHMDKIQTITAEKERISTELTLATRIQESMLPNIFPPFPDRCEFDLYAGMDPAKEVGGDFYDFFLIDDDHLALVIADVSGKGVPAALFMMISKILVKNYAMTGLSPAKTLEAVNKQICANNKEEMFVTVWLGVLEISTGKLTAANAGHEYPVLKSPEGGFELVKDKHGLVVGAMDGLKYKEYELNLEPGSKLFVYTDGVPEATDSAKELFGVDRMLATLNAHKDDDPESLLKNLRRAVNDFVKDAAQFDDLTMLCMEYRGNPENGKNV